MRCYEDTVSDITTGQIDIWQDFLHEQSNYAAVEYSDFPYYTPFQHLCYKVMDGITWIYRAATIPLLLLAVWTIIKGFALFKYQIFETQLMLFIIPGMLAMGIFRIFIIAFRDIEDCDSFSFPKPIPLEATIEDIIDRNVKHDDIYYYGSESRYFKKLNAKIVDKTGIYRIDDSGIATRKWDICPTLKANMGTYYDRVPVIRDDYGIRKLTPMECLAFQGFPKEFTFKGISLENAYKQCGNTVCVPVIEQIAKNICSIIR
jgi:hypothetical protein